MVDQEFLPSATSMGPSICSRIKWWIDTMKKFFTSLVDILKDDRAEFGLRLLRYWRLFKEAVNLYLHGLKGKKLEMQKGEHYVDLSYKFGDATYQKLLDDSKFTLVKISYFQRSLSGLLCRIVESMDSNTGVDEFIKEKFKACSETGETDEHEVEMVKDLGNHHFLILELQPGDCEAEKIWVMAEKTGAREVEKAVIHVKYLTPFKLKNILHDGVHFHTIECNTSISLNFIIDLLKKEGPDYCILEANGWDYVRNTTKLLLKECIQQSTTSATERRRLQDEHDSL